MSNAHKIGLAKERKDQKRFGAKGTPRSGGLWFAKGDNKTKSFLIENKSTDKQSFSVKLKTFQKIEKEAIYEGRIPLLSISIGDDKRELVVLAIEDFEALIHNHALAEEKACELHTNCIATEYGNCQFKCIKHEQNGQIWMESNV